MKPGKLRVRLGQHCDVDGCIIDNVIMLIQLSKSAVKTLALFDNRTLLTRVNATTSAHGHGYLRSGNFSFDNYVHSGNHVGATRFILDGESDTTYKQLINLCYPCTFWW